MSLEGEIALVTGASRGIGQAVALRLGKDGATIIGTATSESGAENITAYLKDSGINGMGLKLDVTDQSSVDSVLETITKEFGDPGILVNNAGINPIYKSAELISEEEWDEIINVNLKGVFLLSQEVGRIMIKQQKGSIINITSINGLLGSSKAVPYSTTSPPV